MLNPGAIVTIYDQKYKVVKNTSGSDPCILCSFTHLEGYLFPCSMCNARKLEERLIPNGYYLQPYRKTYKPGQLVTINGHVYRICKASNKTSTCYACSKANGGIVCFMNNYKSGSCAKYTPYRCYPKLIK